MIGNVDIKTNNVHFYVQRTKEFRLPTKGGYNLNYQYQWLNVGGTMNKSTGVFTAPVGGIYHFDFNALKSKSNGLLKVHLHINSRPHATAFLDDVPNHQLRGKKKSNTDTGEERFYGPPTSCDDLQRLRYTLNGYFLIKGKGQSNANRIQVVYCQFQQPESSNKQSIIKFINEKKASPFSLNNKILNYNNRFGNFDWKRSS